jgi:hypothetical protein
MCLLRPNSRGDFFFFPLFIAYELQAGAADKDTQFNELTNEVVLTGRRR